MGMPVAGVVEGGMPAGNTAGVKRDDMVWGVKTAWDPGLQKERAGHTPRAWGANACVSVLWRTQP